jgi:hypothetical protein
MVGVMVSAGPAPIPLSLGISQFLVKCPLKRHYLHACSHETIVRIRSCSPYATTKADQSRYNHNRPSTKACLNWHPRIISKDPPLGHAAGAVGTLGAIPSLNAP